METLGQSKLRTYVSGEMLHKGATNKEIRNGQGRDIRSFPSLAHAVASLSFYNRDHVLLFRGQGEDFRNLDDNTSIQPKIFRGYRNELRFEWHAIINDRYMRLVRAEELLVEAWKRNKLPDQLRIERHRSIRWAVIQHYEICATPLLDVTQSLRIAATFALRNAVDDEAFLYVLAVPQISGAITASAEAELQILRLSSICPPSAVRPHFQEGFLLGHYPELHSADQKRQYPLYEVDFGRRLLCKFRLVDLSTFWKSGFTAAPDIALLPERKDPLVKIANQIKTQLSLER